MRNGGQQKLKKSTDFWTIGSELSTHSIQVVVIEKLNQIIKDKLFSNATTWNVSKEDDKGFFVAIRTFIVKRYFE